MSKLNYCRKGWSCWTLLD